MKMKMKIGVAIPCYVGHIDKLFNLLNSLEKQSVLPDKVVVCCSSTKEIQNKNNYSFQLAIIICLDKKTAAENRNIAASILLEDMDYITFFDADDIMHPERIEVLHKVINENNSDVILHNFYYNHELDIREGFPCIENIEIRNNTLIPAPSGCVTHIYGYHDSIDRIHHGQVTIKKDLFYTVKFPEEPEFYSREDSIFCNRLLQIENIKNTYIINKLSFYQPSSTLGYLEL
jgi:hypothetical protein